MNVHNSDKTGVWDTAGEGVTEVTQSTGAQSHRRAGSPPDLSTFPPGPHAALLVLVLALATRRMISTEAKMPPQPRKYLQLF